MSIPNLRECLEPGIDKYERVIYRKAVRINSGRSQIFATQNLKAKSGDILIEALPNTLPDETAIRLSTNDLGTDCLEIIMNGQLKELFTEDGDGYPVEALYTKINGFVIEAKFNRENPIRGDVKAILEISDCVKGDTVVDSIF